MKRLIVGDLHLDARVGIKRVYEIVKDSLDKIAWLSHNYDEVIFLGDYFVKNSPSNYFRRLFSDFLVRVKPKKRKIFLKGNHDIDYSDGTPFIGSFSLDVLRSFLNEHDIVVDNFYEDDGVAYISYSLDFEKIAKFISETECKLVFGHIAIGTYSLGEGIPERKGEIQVAKKNTRYILGHIHKAQRVKRDDNIDIIYVGSIGPTNLGEIGYSSYLCSLIDDKLKKEDLKYGLEKIEVNNVDDINNINENSRVVIEIDDLSEKQIYLDKLKDKALSIEFRLKRKKVIIDSKISFEKLLEEFLRKINKLYLLDKINKYINEAR